MRVAFVAGTLGQGGAEKQLVYMARALREAGVDVRVYCLTSGEYHEAALREAGIPVVWVGQRASFGRRLYTLTRELYRFRPHIVQSAHFYTNLYAGLSARLARSISIGAIRSDGLLEMRAWGRMGRLLLRAPHALIANSLAGRRNVERLGVPPGKLNVLPNVIDLARFDCLSAEEAAASPARDRIAVITVGRMIREKRFDRFIEALSLARREESMLEGVLVGDGPERASIERFAEAQGLLPDGLTLLGQRDDVPALLRQAQIMALTSDQEGFPNVLLEAMAARLPVIATPAGDAGIVVEDGVTGCVVDFEDVRGMAERMVCLAQSASLRRQLGEAGRRRVERDYSFTSLAPRLMNLYKEVARHQKYSPLLPLLIPYRWE
jgi:glycosyltransferase involved in cell wall biosynthesis